MPELLVSEDESIKLEQLLTSNPNVGGFGQGDAEIVLQDPLRSICCSGTNIFNLRFAPVVETILSVPE
ncbi:unnamed protein product [Spirodela intermedia]|uniref:Uncharacterized protein n=2 Tax=Spirodela intermedia TaxID=51605 RepID=A0A7I8IP13_SPIIN|nr:unnamed protein product [Spirodela intermedia]CAA6659688.1 unnamed protein product [Spirodela intermedia]CAA7396021.1 unnamed protein product [Spirodela intermedia]